MTLLENTPHAFYISFKRKVYSPYVQLHTSPYIIHDNVYTYRYIEYICSSSLSSPLSCDIHTFSYEICKMRRRFLSIFHMSLLFVYASEYQKKICDVMNLHSDRCPSSRYLSSCVVQLFHPPPDLLWTKVRFQIMCES